MCPTEQTHSRSHVRRSWLFTTVIAIISIVALAVLTFGSPMRSVHSPAPSDEQWKKAYDAYTRGQFKEMEQAIEQIPKDSPLASKAHDLLKKDPLKVQISDFVPETVEVKQTLPFMIAADTPAIAVVGYQKRADWGFEGDFYLIVWKKDSSSYQLVAHNAVLAAELSVMAAPLFGDDRNALILQAKQGSGVYDDVTVYSIEPVSGEIKQYPVAQQQYQGNAGVENNRLVVWSADRKTVYTWDGNRFVGSPDFTHSPTGPSDVVVHYSLNPDGTVTSDQDNVTLRTGQKLFLFREDRDLSLHDRVLLSSDGVLDHADSTNREVLIAEKAGSASIMIIPGGYNWENAKNITVNVVP